jgi:aspartate/methionine/tyrosine aminotransferase
VFSAGGYRLGFMALPQEFRGLAQVYRSLFSETFSCVASPVQYAGVKAYEYSESLQQYVSDASAILSGISAFVHETFTEHRIQCTNPQGAFYMMIGFDAFEGQIRQLGIQTSQELALYLLETYQVALLPGSDFGFDDTEFFFRLAFVDFNGETVMNAYEKSKTIDEDFIRKECPSMYKGTQQLIQFVNDLMNS